MRRGHVCVRLLEGNAVNVVGERQSIRSTDDTEIKGRTNAKLDVIMTTGNELMTQHRKKRQDDEGLTVGSTDL